MQVRLTVSQFRDTFSLEYNPALDSHLKLLPPEAELDVITATKYVRIAYQDTHLYVPMRYMRFRTTTSDISG